MFFLLMILFAVISFITGIIIISILDKTKLSYALFYFLLFASLWQLDVAVLYGSEYLSADTIDILFRLFRIGTIMLTPSLFYVALVIWEEMIPDSKKTKWSYVINKKTNLLLLVFSSAVYIIGWSKLGINHFITVRSYSYPNFLFPVYGDLSWIYTANLLLCLFCIVVCFIASSKVQSADIRSFLLYFLITTTVGFFIGFLNMFPESKLFASGFSVMIYSISILILVTRMHTSTINKMNITLEQKEQFLSTVVNANPNLIYSLNSNGVFTLVNTGFANFFGLSINEILGKSEAEFQAYTGRNIHFSKLDDPNNLTEIPEERAIDFEGNKKWLKTVKVPINSNNEESMLSVSTDITSIKKQQEEISWLAFHDELTGLSNRRHFNEQLYSKVEIAKHKNGCLSILFLDLDRFKYINDTLGHKCGDELLRQFANHLKSCTDLPDASLFRIGGDEFTFILSNTNSQQAIAFAKQVIDCFKKAFTVDGNSLFITTSIGISTYPKDSTDPNTLITNADSAMHHIKERGKNGYQIYTPEMNHSFYRNMVLEKELRKAVEQNKEFELFYQSQLDVKKKKIVGAEALLRWTNKDLGSVTPEEFIPLAEETGLIVPLGEWVLRTACRQIREWQLYGYDPLNIAVNVSYRQFAEHNFVEKVLDILNETGLDPTFLELEITENIEMTSEDNVISKLNELHSHGICISIDDFGKGYSSLSYLRKYPVDRLKIDKSFIKNIQLEHENLAIVKSIISIAKNLHMEVVAEGVENKQELDFVSKLDCEFAQGYYISHPLTASNFEQNILGT
ncbi:EAL domain-containing protein [Virgibacillus flavescens]|uniref:sensor domain-containing protein n=1 Tax=Virgibacillus flavescens TaxID=1611422 RepID=UPI003D351B5E